MQVEMRPITSIRPYENNPRLNDEAVDAVAASIRAFGFRQPIVVDEQDVIIVGHNPQAMVHLTEKPTELATRAIEYRSKPGENVLDLFGGSTLIAAEQTGRNAYLMELDPLYCVVIIARYEQLTGQKAERVA
jgi:hypothetical protein